MAACITLDRDIRRDEVADTGSRLRDTIVCNASTICDAIKKNFYVFIAVWMRTNGDVDHVCVVRGEACVSTSKINPPQR